MKYPSTKNVLLIFIAILLVGGGFIVAEYRNGKAEAIYSAPITATVTDDDLTNIQKTDSDGDGLADWEEILIGTDPKNADTDHDGTPDGKEVQLGRNPLVKGPNDKISKTASADLTKTTENLTATDKLGRDFFARYMQLRAMGISSDKQSQSEIVNESLRNGSVISRPKTYTSTEILIRSDNNKESVKKYINDAGAVFKRYSIHSRNETIIAKEAIERKDSNVLKEIDPIIVSYRNTFNGLLKVEVPQAMTQMHVDLINSVNILLFVAEGLRKADVDPLLGIQATSMYIDGVQSFVVAYNGIKSYLTFLGITYVSDDGGSFFQKNK